MGQIAIAVKHLIAAGISGDDLVRAIEEMEGACAPAPPQRKKRDPNSPGAKRQREYIERRDAASQAVTMDSSDVSDACDVISPVVTSQRVTANGSENLSPQTPLSDNKNIYTAGARETELAELEAFCRQSLNGSLIDGPVPGIDVIDRLMRPKRGEPCTRDNIEAGLKNAAARHYSTGGNKFTSFAQLEGFCLQARDQSLRPNPKVEILDGRPNDASRGGGAAFRRGPAEDPIDRLRNRMGGREAPADIIEHTGVVSRARAGVG